jgi:hypothetical protein
MTFTTQNAPHTFDFASDALSAALAYECSHTSERQYEVLAVYAADRSIVGYQVRVKDADGFGLFWIGES